MADTLPATAHLSPLPGLHGLPPSHAARGGPAGASPDGARTTRTLRLDTLIRLRWLAVVGQTLSVVFVHYGLGFPLPLPECLALILVPVVVNLALRLRYPVSERVEALRATAFLAFDIVQLAALLFLTGGLTNPFSFLFLAPVMISATSLTPRLTMVLGGLAVVCSTLLVLWHLPLPWFPGVGLDMPYLYVVGMWFSVLLGLGFIGVYAWRVADESRLLSDALTATELVLAREQHLSQLDGLAAAAAHELGTPLATIALVAKEMERNATPGHPFAEDIRLLRSQVERCREILGKLASLGQAEGVPFDRLPLSQLIEEAVAPNRDFGIALRVEMEPGQPGAPEPELWRSAGLSYGLGNIVENAVDFAKAGVTVRAAWDARTLTLTVMDDGPGFPTDIMGRLGDPYITNRRPRDPGQPGGGLGLGFFIAKTLLERSGCTLALSNREPPQTGAVVRLTWPREALDSGARDGAARGGGALAMPATAAAGPART